MNRRAFVVGLVLLGLVGGGVIAWKARGKRAKVAAPSTKPAPAAGPKEKPAVPKAESSGPPPDVRVKYDLDPAGTLRLEGQVIDSDEHPVSGAQVALSSNPRREVTSEADGSFAFDKLVGREYSLEAHKEESWGGPVRVKLTDKTEPVILRMKAGGIVEVSVVEADARIPVAGATLDLRGLVSLLGSTGANGMATFRGVRAGWHVVAVSAAGYAPAWHTFQTSGTAGVIERQTVELRKGAAVLGRVVDATGKPVAGARVMFESASALFSAANAGDDGVSTDAKGAWRFAVLPAGTFRFSASHEKFAPGVSAPVSLDGKSERRDVTITLEPGARIAGLVVSKEGQPVPAAAVRVAAAEGGWDDEVQRRAFTNDAGEFDLDDLPRRAVAVIAVHESAASGILELDLAATPEKTGLVLTLDVDGAISGVVVSTAGQPVPEAQVMALPEFGSGDSSRSDWKLRGVVSDIADSGGRFALSGLRPGAYRVRGARPGASPQALWLRPGVPAKAGDSAVKLTVDADGRVKGKVLYADGTAPDPFSVEVGFGSPVPRSGTQGAFSLEAPAGKQLLSVTGAAFAKKVVEVDVKPDAETDAGTITVEKGRSVSGRVLAPSGAPVAEATVVAAKELVGTGSELSMSLFGRGNLKEAKTDESGTYLITGVGPKALVVAADHPALGRSVVVPIASGSGSAQVDLELLPPGLLEGKVTRSGAPVGKAILIASPRAATSGNFIVTSGADGTFKFDRLSPDTYLVSAMLQTGGMGASGNFQSKLVKVVAGQTARVDLEIPSGGVTLQVKVSGQGGAKVESAQIFLFSGTVRATTADVVMQAVAERGDGSMMTGFTIKGTPAKIENVPAGAYTLCAIPFAGDANNATEMLKLQEKIESLRVECQPRTIAASPATQEVTLVVPPPAPL